MSYSGCLHENLQEIKCQVKVQKREPFVSGVAKLSLSSA